MGHYTAHWGDKHLAGASEGLMEHTFKGYWKKVRCQTKCCIFFWWDMSSQDRLTYELLKICRCDRAPREDGWSEFSVGCLAGSINKWTHQWMSEGDIRRDMLHNLWMKNNPQQFYFAGLQPMFPPLIVLQRRSLIAQCQLGQNQLDSSLVYWNVLILLR